MPRVLHFGPGNFHRAHQAWYTQMAGGWTITGVSLRAATTRDALAGQGYAYTLVTQDATGVRDTRITVIDRILVGPEDPNAVLALIADPDTQVITTTVTEKGYHLDGAGRLQIAGLIADDIKTEAPATLMGYLARGLAARQAAGAGPLTVVCCDNLSENGTSLQGAVRDFAAAAGLALNLNGVRFPNTMVDRITPRPTEALAQEVAARTGWPDASPVVTEGFTEWVIADDFAGPRPAWETAGAQFVADVAPFELRKLRMLNGAHSLLAYLGTLRGHRFVHEAMADAPLRADVNALMNAAMKTLGGPTDDLYAYCDALLARFDNPGLAHSLAQIAMDGSQKMPIRILSPLRDLMAQDHPAEAHLKALASWITFVSRAKTLDDPQAAALLAAANTDDPVTRICAEIKADFDAPVLNRLHKICAAL